MSSTVSKKSRAERKNTKVYKLQALFRPSPSKSPLSEAELASAPEHYLVGEVDNVFFVSVPESTSANAAEHLRDMLSVAFGDKKQVMVLTHNVELLAAKKLAPNDAAAVLRQIGAAGDA